MRPEPLAAPFLFGIESVDGIGVVLDKVEEDIQMSSHDVFLLASESETFAPWLSLGPDESETFICEGTGLRDVKELALSGKVVDDSNHGVGFAVRAEEQWPCMLFHKRRGVPEWPSQLWRPVTGASEHDTDKRNDGLSTPGHSIPGASGQNTGGSNDLPTAIFSAETPTSSASADCMRVEITTVVPTPTFINAPTNSMVKVAERQHDGQPPIGEGGEGEEGAGAGLAGSPVMAQQQDAIPSLPSDECYLEQTFPYQSSFFT